MTNVKTGWNRDDEDIAIQSGWYVGHRMVRPLGLASAVQQHTIAIVHTMSAKQRWGRETFSSAEEATTHVMTQMLAGDALCYKAMRIVCKTNPAYESYKPMVREVRKKYDW